MEAQLEKRTRLTFSWNYEKEEQWLNEMSEKGLHLTKAGAIRSTFNRDQSVRYTYGLDYQLGLKNEESFQEYIQLYKDAGWEYVTSYGAMWHYFRRIWKPGETPRLYTDVSSLCGQYKKIQRILALMMLVNLIILTANMTNLFSHSVHRFWGIIFPALIIYLLLFAVMGYGYLKLGKKIKKMKKED